jgi:hypothetical protein
MAFEEEWNSHATSGTRKPRAGTAGMGGFLPVRFRPERAGTGRSARGLVYRFSAARSENCRLVRLIRLRSSP